MTSKKSGRQWVIDVCGAQYGIFQPFWAWNDYKARFVKQVKAQRRPGWNKGLLSKLAKIEGNPSLLYGLIGEIASELDKAVDRWEAHRMRLAKLPSLEHDRFDKERANLLNLLDAEVQKFIKSNDFLPRINAAKAYEAHYPGRSTFMTMTIPH